MYIESKSWLDLKPLLIGYGNIEYFEDYYNRIKSKTNFSHIPETVFKQWLWANHDKTDSIKNYGWLDYENIEFQICNWPIEKFRNIYVIENYRNYYNIRASYDDLSSFHCTSEDLRNWKEYGTWRTPPVILDVESITQKIPNWCELGFPYHLVEGHSRCGYLQSMLTIDRLGKEKIAKKHEVYLMKLKPANA